jgi:hypothetical protein
VYTAIQVASSVKRISTLPSAGKATPFSGEESESAKLNECKNAAFARDDQFDLMTTRQKMQRF